MLKRVEVWKKFIDLDITDSYPQKVNAGFEYLNADGLGYFTLMVG